MTANDNNIYDLIIIGSGPGGEKAAAKASYYGYRVALVEKEEALGGAGANTGTLPSKTLKETALYYSGFYEKGLFGVDKDLERAASAQDFFFRKNQVVQEQDDSIRRNLELHNVDLYHGWGSLVDEQTIRVEGSKTVELRGQYILLATGSYPYHPKGIPFDGKHVHDSDTILTIDRIPQSLVVVGAGVIGCEYATIFAVMGVKVKVINSSDQILGFLDREICAALQSKMEQDGVEFVFGGRVEGVEILRAGESPLVRAHMTDGKPLEAEMFLYAAGRCGSSNNLNLEKVGIQTGNRGQILVDKEYRTAVPNIFAIGDVIGFPALASTSMDQGRVAVTHMFGLHGQESISPHFPYGIYTIPEVSVYGLTEEDAKAQGVDYCIGRARYTDMPRGKIMGVREGMLKVVFDSQSRQVLGVHIFGKIATELIHYGISLVDGKATLMDIIGRVYNTPTLHELYKYAAYDGLVEQGFGKEATGF